MGIGTLLADRSFFRGLLGVPGSLPCRVEEVSNWKRLIFPTVIVARSWLLVSAATTYYIYWLNQSYQRVFNENVHAIYSSSRIQEAAWKILAGVNATATDATLTRPVFAWSSSAPYKNSDTVP